MVAVFTNHHSESKPYIFPEVSIQLILPCATSISSLGLVHKNRIRHNYCPSSQDKENELQKILGLRLAVVGQNRIKKAILSIRSGLTTNAVWHNRINGSKTSNFFRTPLLNPHFPFKNPSFRCKILFFIPFKGVRRSIIRHLLCLNDVRSCFNDIRLSINRHLLCFIDIRSCFIDILRSINRHLLCFIDVRNCFIDILRSFRRQLFCSNEEL